MTILTRTATSVAETIAAVRELMAVWNPTGSAPQEVWFRGQGRRRYKLVPGLYRAASLTYKYNEFALMSAFRNYSTPYVTSRPESAWEWYFLAQHYRVPTRLLDWTENLLVAMYFALAEEMEKLDQASLRAARAATPVGSVFDAESPTVWLLDAGSLNYWSTTIDGVYAPPNARIDKYQWQEFAADPASASKPIAVFAAHQNPRIRAQQGTFTLHGTLQDPLDEIATNLDPAGAIHIGCIELDRTRLASLWYELGLIGVSRLSVFPELDSVAEHVKFNFQND